MRHGRALNAAVAVVCIPLVCGCTSKSDDAGSTATTDAGGGAAEPPPDGTAAAMATLFSDGYVDDNACRECHRSLFGSYQHVTMSKSSYPWTAQNAIEDFDNNTFYHEASHRYYEMNAEGDDLKLTRYQLRDDGERTNEITIGVDWVIGSGANARTYVYQTPSGEMFQLPLGWYSKDGVWGMSPGYDATNHQGITRAIGRDCMFCHNAFPDIPANGDAFGAMQAYPQSLPHGIGCQRCHGPGAEHVRVAGDLDAPIRAVRQAIVNPINLDGHARTDVCLQCHMQPSSQLAAIIPRFGTKRFSYRPGAQLADHLVHVDFDGEFQRGEVFEVNHHAYRMQQSVCFSASGWALDCLTCHNPHNKVAKVDAAAFYRDRCLTCHQIDDCTVEAMAQGQPHDVPLDDCVACHMPSRRPDDAIHAIVTDHRIVRRPPPGDLLALRPEHVADRTALPGFLWPDRAPSGAEGELYLAIAAAVGDVGAADRLAAAIEAAQPTHAEPYYHLGLALLRSGRAAEAIAPLKRAIEFEPNLPAAHLNLGVAYSSTGRADLADSHFRTVIELEPASAEAHANLGDLYASRRQFDEARELFIEALRWRPTFAQARLSLGNAHVQQGDFAGAAGHYRVALAINPRLESAYRNQAAALRRLERWEEALAVLRHGVTEATESAELTSQLALLLLASPQLELRDAAQADVFATAAIELDPNHRGATLAIALAALMNGRYTQAIQLAARAGQGGADPLAASLILAIAFERSGNSAQAQAATAAAQRLAEQVRNTNYIQQALQAMAADQ